MPRSASPAVVCACIDIGSNTTRLLVADCTGARPREVAQARAFTQLGAGRPLAPGKIEEVAAAVADQAALARAAGAKRLRIVATASVRRTPGAEALVEAAERAAGAAVEVLEEADEARLAFRGATAAVAAGDAPVAVVDIGGGSTELAVGDPGGTPAWWRSVPIGSAEVIEGCGGDPPGDMDLDRMRREVAAAFEGLDAPPPSARALAVGGSATSLCALAGGRLTADALAAALARVCAAPAAATARTTGLDSRRVRLLPAGIVLLEAAARRLGRPLEVAAGGLREGIVLELAASVA